ncbi:MAG: hypothetical protein JXQ84_04670, partial [Rhodospirillaceae bacterium]|nr:hypothetical protein [Rhodospirillaceae bacterium]
VRPRRGGGSGEAMLSGAITALEGCDFVVDSGADDDGAGGTNHRILEVAVARGIPVFSMGHAANPVAGWRRCGSLTDLVTAIDHLQA